MQTVIMVQSWKDCGTADCDAIKQSPELAIHSYEGATGVRRRINAEDSAVRRYIQ